MDSRINERNDLQVIIDKTLEDMRQDVGGTLRPDDVNLAEFARRSGLTRSKACTLKAKGVQVDGARQVRDEGDCHGHDRPRGGRERAAARRRH